MTPILKRIWKRVRRGEDLETYLALSAILMLFVCRLWGLANVEKYIPPLTLAALGILMLGLLRVRHRIEELCDRVSPHSTYIRDEELSNRIASEIAAAEELWLMGIHMRNSIRKYSPLFEKRLRRGARVRVMLVSEQGGASAMSADREDGDVERLKLQIRSALKQLCHLQQSFPEKIEIRTINYPLDYRAIIVNPNEPDTVIFVKRYTFRVDGGIEGASPNFVYTLADPEWHRLITSEFKELWQRAEPYSCSDLLAL